MAIPRQATSSERLDTFRFDPRRILLISCGLALVSLYLQTVAPWAQQIGLVNRVRASGGQVTFQRVGPQWVRAMLGSRVMEGIDPIVAVIGVTEVQDERAFVEALSGCESLKDLEVELSNRGLHRLRNLENLERLKLHGEFSAIGLRHLERFPNLRVLQLHDAKFLATDLRAVMNLPELEQLHLSTEQIEDFNGDMMPRANRLNRLVLHGAPPDNSKVKELEKAFPGSRIEVAIEAVETTTLVTDSDSHA